MAQKYSNGSNIYQIFLMAPIWNGIGFRMPMMHCPTFGSLASLKYLKTCFQTCFQKTFLKYLKTFIKCIKTLMRWLKHLSNLEWHWFQDAPSTLPNLRFTHRTLTPLVLHTYVHKHKHTYVHNPEVNIAEGAIPVTRVSNG